MEQQYSPVQNITVVGTGVIGNGWIARFLARGYDVVATDPDENAEARMRAAVDNAWPALERTGLAPGASRERLRFEPRLENAVAGADLVQESAPEREELKRELLARIDKNTGPNTIIASSTSGFMPSTLQQDCQNPGRVIVAHPFNPVYLLPLVELVGGKQTEPGVIERASGFYKTAGMRPLVLHKEVEGHVADRLMEALWREALHIVNDGVATTEEVDAAIVYGAGLRWALMGPFMTFHLGGGEQGMRTFLKQFGPALKLPWTRLEAPELTDELIDRVAGGCEYQSAGKSVSELEQRRDDFLIRLLDLVEEYWPEAEGMEGRI